MGMRLAVGKTLVSAVDTTSVVIVKAPTGVVELTCGGVALHEKGALAADGELDPSMLGGTQMGKRYVDESGSVELLCVKAGRGTLMLDGAPLVLRSARPLPSSD